MPSLSVTHRLHKTYPCTNSHRLCGARTHTLSNRSIQTSDRLCRSRSNRASVGLWQHNGRGCKKSRKRAGRSRNPHRRAHRLCRRHHRRHSAGHNRKPHWQIPIQKVNRRTQKKASHTAKSFYISVNPDLWILYYPNIIIIQRQNKPVCTVTKAVHKVNLAEFHP